MLTFAPHKEQSFMADKKGWGSTVAGWFIVQDEGHPASADDSAGQTDADAIINKYASEGSSSSASSYGTEGSGGGGDNLPPAGEFFQNAPPAATGGKVDFDAVFDAAGVDAEERGRVGKAVELLRSLPADTDKTVKKQIVEASLRAFGVPVEKIIESGAEEIQALEFYIRAGAGETEKMIGESETLIRDYEEKIADIRKLMQTRVAEQQQVIKACNDKKLEVQQILEFFGRDAVAAVVKASPKLHDPSGATDAPTT
jgi:hypothetical protein